MFAFFPRGEAKANYGYDSTRSQKEDPKPHLFRIICYNAKHFRIRRRDPCPDRSSGEYTQEV
jgi:hypothetical protein